jgi:hypothetical protein
MLGNDREAAISQLVVVAFFFAMRSCEYSGVQGERLTTVVGVDDIRFWTNDKLVAVDDHDKMRSADSVSVTFRRQKNRDNGVVVTQHRNNRLGKGEMCPVRTLADLVGRIRSYTEFQTTGGTNVGINTFKSRNEGAKIEWISSKEVLKQLRAAAETVGERRLGFSIDSIGTHSIRAGAAMAMYLAGVPCETIQLIGRWKSQTFMKYLRIQVPASTRGVSSKMTSLDSFFTITISDDSDEHEESTQNQNGRNQVDIRKRARTNPERKARSDREQGNALLGPDSEATKSSRVSYSRMGPAGRTVSIGRHSARHN